MASNRFQVTLVSERPRERVVPHVPETIPLIHVEAEVPSPPPMPVSFTSINETNKTSSGLLNSFMHRFKSNMNSSSMIPTMDTPLVPVPYAISNATLPVSIEIEKPDSYYSTTNSNIFDTMSLPFTNEFLHELRTKRRELREKARNLPIDQRIALNRQQNDREIIRAQDIFAVHFEMNDNENLPTNIFTEDAQEKIRNSIFDELDRQRMKKYHKQHRQLILGRALLIFITSLIMFMGITLIYVVIDLFERAKLAESNLPESQFISIAFDAPVEFQF